MSSYTWLNSAKLSRPLYFAVFSHLDEVPLIQHCINRDWQQDAALWRAGEMNLAAWCQQLLAPRCKIHFARAPQGGILLPVTVDAVLDQRDFIQMRENGKIERPGQLGAVEPRITRQPPLMPLIIAQ